MEAWGMGEMLFRDRRAVGAPSCILPAWHAYCAPPYPALAPDRPTCMARMSTSGGCGVLRQGRWCRNSAKETALSEWKEATAL